MSIDKLVQNVISAYAHDPEGLTPEECKGLTQSQKQADALCSALGTGASPLTGGAEGVITQEERADLQAAGFAAEFIKGIAGTDGNEALHERAKWLGDNVVKKWWRWDFDCETRGKFAWELGCIGPLAEYTVPALVEAIKDQCSFIKNPVDLVSSCGNYVAEAAARALGRMGPAGESALWPLFNRDDENECVNDRATEGLRAFERHLL